MTNFAQKQQWIVDLEQEAKKAQQSLKSEFRQYIQDTRVPLMERWKTWIQESNDESWYQRGDGMGWNGDTRSKILQGFLDNNRTHCMKLMKIAERWDDGFGTSYRYHAVPWEKVLQPFLVDPSPYIQEVMEEILKVNERKVVFH